MKLGGAHAPGAPPPGSYAHTTLYYIVPWLYLTLLVSATLVLLHYSVPLLGCTALCYTLSWVYVSLLDSTTLGHTWFYLTLRHTSALYSDSTCICLYLTLLHCTLYHGSTWFYYTLLHYTVALLGSICLCLTLLHCTTLYHGSTWLYLTLLHSTSLHYDSTYSAWLHYMHCTTLHWRSMYLTLLHSSMTLYLASWRTWLYILYHGSTWHYSSLLQ